MLAVDHENVKPDLLLLGKILCVVRDCHLLALKSRKNFQISGWPQGVRDMESGITLMRLIRQ